jgi:hypothetical protein
VNPTTIGELKEEVAMTLTLFKQEFPPSFFDIIMHFLVHLMEELEICSLVHTRWMYPIEHYFKTSKGYICKILPPLNVGCGMKKKARQCLMKCLKEVRIHV